MSKYAAIDELDDGMDREILRMHNDFYLTRWYMEEPGRPSITSNPLFMRVAESMVIRFPIFQVGWFKACPIVIEGNSDFGVFNGPPEAVSQMRCTSSIRPPRMHWCTALCSLSTGSSGLPCLRASAATSSPAATEAFFVGEAYGFSGFHRLVRRFETGYSDDRADHKINIGISGNPHIPGCTMNDFNYVGTDAFGFEFVAENFCICFARNGKKPRFPAHRLLNAESMFEPAARATIWKSVW